jgi:hypothetical protein
MAIQAAASKNSPEIHATPGAAISGAERREDMM